MTANGPDMSWWPNPTNTVAGGCESLVPDGYRIEHIGQLQ